MGFFDSTSKQSAQTTTVSQGTGLINVSRTGRGALFGQGSQTNFNVGLTGANVSDLAGTLGNAFANAYSGSYNAFHSLSDPNPAPMPVASPANDAPPVQSGPDTTVIILTVIGIFVLFILPER